MNPRLSTSKSWTALPVDFVTKVKKVFNDEFKTEAAKGDFIVEGRIYPDEILVRMGYLERGRLKQVNFEASMDLRGGKKMVNLDLDQDLDGLEGADPAEIDDLYETVADQDDEFGDDSMDPDARELKKSETAMERLYACIDALGSTMDEYFEVGDEKDMDIPPTWRAYEFEGDTIYLQQSNVNTSLEEEANRLLGLMADEMVLEDTPTEDALLHAEIDTELAEGIQKAIRNGTYKNPAKNQSAAGDAFGAEDAELAPVTFGETEDDDQASLHLHQVRRTPCNPSDESPGH